MEIINRSMPLGLIAVVIGAVFPISVLATGLQTEIQKALPARGPIPFAVFDHDASGFITAAELESTRNARMAMKSGENRPMHGMANMPTFSDMDIDGDGKLTKEELMASQNAHRQGCSEMMGQGKGMGKRQGMAMGKNMPAFADFDIDGDGKIVEVEFSEARQQHLNEMEQQGRQMKNMSHAPSFEEIDRNDDGEINSDEFAAHQSERRQNMKQQQ